MANITISLEFARNILEQLNGHIYNDFKLLILQHEKIKAEILRVNLKCAHTNAQRCLDAKFGSARKSTHKITLELIEKYRVSY